MQPLTRIHHAMANQVSPVEGPYPWDIRVREKLKRWVHGAIGKRLSPFLCIYSLLSCRSTAPHGVVNDILSLFRLFKS